MDKVKRVKGFTLIELLITAVIIGILAVIITANVSDKIRIAITTEALQGLGMIRTAERAYFSEHGRYLEIQPIDDISDLPSIRGRSNPNAYDGDLDGTYFSQECYLVLGASETGFYGFLGCMANSTSMR